MDTTIRAVELDFIKSEIGFYLDLVLPLVNRQSSGILFSGLMPFLSLFTVETYKYIQKALPSYAHSLLINNREIIEASRMRVKFFDDTEKRLDGMFELLGWILEFHKEWHIKRHRGFLAPLRRALQDDLGIFAYDGHVIGSTHIGLFYYGFDKEDLPTTSKEISAVLGSLPGSVGEGLGYYLGQLCNYPEFAPIASDNAHFEYNIQDDKLGYKDMKSQKFFTSVFNGAGTEEINFSLLLFLTTVNFFQYILKRLLVGTPYTLFKLKFIMLYHLASSLGKIQDYYYPKNLLSNRSKKYFQDILKDKDLKMIKEQSKFRNILVHYTVDGVPAEIFVPSINLFGLSEYFFSGLTYHELNKKLDEQIERVSLLLEDWLDWRTMPSQFSSWSSV